MVQNKGANGQAKALGHQNAEELIEESDEEAGGGAFQAGHPIDYEDENGGKDELHWEVACGP